MLYLSFQNELLEILRDDETVSALEIQLERPIQPMDIKTQPNVQLNRRTQNSYKKSIASIQGLYSLLNMVNKDTGQPDDVKKFAQTLQERILAETPDIKP